MIDSQLNYYLLRMNIFGCHIESNSFSISINHSNIHLIHLLIAIDQLESTRITLFAYNVVEILSIEMSMLMMNR